jgi:hypothetical protein
MERVMTSKVEHKAPPPGEVTFEAFLEWADEDTWAEWVDGEIIMMTVNADGAYDSRMAVGFCLRPEWLWAEPLPKVLDVARELGLLD